MLERTEIWAIKNSRALGACNNYAEITLLTASGNYCGHQAAPNCREPEPGSLRHNLSFASCVLGGKVCGVPTSDLISSCLLFKSRPCISCTNTQGETLRRVCIALWGLGSSCSASCTTRRHSRARRPRSTLPSGSWSHHGMLVSVTYWSYWHRASTRMSCVIRLIVALHCAPRSCPALFVCFGPTREREYAFVLFFRGSGPKNRHQTRMSSARNRLVHHSSRHIGHYTSVTVTH